jgi:pyruvate/2-oxoglutarate dehydrogenase complex dihydrolipoamide acyltransferase (E2) component
MTIYFVGSVTSEIQSPVKEQQKVLATPAVRYYARKHGITLENVKGTGKGGRILKQDIVSNLHKEEIKEKGMILVILKLLMIMKNLSVLQRK